MGCVSCSDCLHGHLMLLDFYFIFFQKVYGSKTEKARWLECLVTLIQDVMGNAVGRLFVEKHFDTTSKATVSEINQI